MAVLMTDPLAANLTLLGVLLMGLAFYAGTKYVLRKDYANLDREFGYFLLAIGGYFTVYGLFDSLLWPAPMTGAYNILFGDSMAVLGFVSLMGGISLVKNLGLGFVSIFAFFAGIYALVSGVAGYNYGMTSAPLALLGMYMGAGVSGILMPIAYFTRELSALSTHGIRNTQKPGKDAAAIAMHGITISQIFAILFIVAAVIGAIVALYTGYSAVVEHLHAFASTPGL